MRTRYISFILGLGIMAFLSVSCSDDDTVKETNVDQEVVADASDDDEEAAGEEGEEREYIETRVIDDDGNIAIPSDYEAMNGLNNDFSWRVYSYIASHETDNAKNLLVSPYSLAVDLAMLANGASGETLDELKSFLAFGDYSIDDINDYFAVLTRGLSQVDTTTSFTSANALWYAQRFPIRKEFSSTLRSWYNAEVHAAKMKTENTLDEINNWVSSNTNGVIEKLFNSVDEIPDVAALLNAIYMDANWTVPFEESLTSNMYFTTANGGTVKARFMMDEWKLKYFAGNNEQVIFRPLGDGQKFDMFFILPNKKTQMADVIAEMEDSWTDMVKNSELEYVRAFLPKFSASYDSNWSDCMANMGCTKLFSKQQADFSSMTSSEGMYVSDIMQRANIIVDESGVVCAAVTASIWASSSGEPRKTIRLTFDRPFLFGLREASTGVILFMGCVNDPSAK